MSARLRLASHQLVTASPRPQFSTKRRRPHRDQPSLSESTTLRLSQLSCSTESSACSNWPTRRLRKHGSKVSALRNKRSTHTRTTSRRKRQVSSPRFQRGGLICKSVASSSRIISNERVSPHTTNLLDIADIQVERTGLCLHLLRLRPSPDQLKKWNRYDTEPSKTHIERGWTAWLQELAGHEVFDDLPKGSSHRIEHRRSLMDQMYAVAEMEEDFLNGAIGMWSKVVGGTCCDRC